MNKVYFIKFSKIDFVQFKDKGLTNPRKYNKGENFEYIGKPILLYIQKEIKIIVMRNLCR